MYNMRQIICTRVQHIFTVLTFWWCCWIRKCCVWILTYPRFTFPSDLKVRKSFKSKWYLLLSLNKSDLIFLLQIQTYLSHRVVCKLKNEDMVKALGLNSRNFKQQTQTTLWIFQVASLCFCHFKIRIWTCHVHSVNNRLIFLTGFYRENVIHMQSDKTVFTNLFKMSCVMFLKWIANTKFFY